MKRILVVDDSATSRLLFKAHMPKDGDYAVVDAKNLDEALEAVAAAPPDMVFLDYNMPDSSGVDIARELRGAGAEAVLYLLTANTQESVLSEARAAGIRGVLEKPITAEKLSKALRDAGL